MPDSNGMVILVDASDRPLGIENKLVAHLGRGKLHRAFSIFILDSSNRLLLQKRASCKYHCPGFWSNSCCSHPQPAEDLVAGAQKRLQHELGFSTVLTEIGTVEYRLTLDNGMVEWELNHLLVGHYEGVVNPCLEEVTECQWTELAKLEKELEVNKEQFTPWLPIILPYLVKFVD